jgi:hypothetical protein
MKFALGWIVCALAGVGAAPQVESSAAQIAYTVRVVEAEGVCWREAVFTRLKPVTRQGAATVWTVTRDTTDRLLAEVLKNPTARILQAPRVTTFAGVPASISSRRNQQLVTLANWDGDEARPDGGSEAVRVGWHTTMVGRKLDQGILVKLVLEDTEIRAIHCVKLKRTGEPTCSSPAQSKGSEPQVFIGSGKAADLTAICYGLGDPACTEGPCTEKQACCSLAGSGVKDQEVQQAAIEIPEIGSQEVLGEWLIPRGEFLLVSLGAHTIADRNGKAVVKERLAIIGAEEISLPTAVHPQSGATSAVPAAVPALPRLPFLPAPISKSPLPAPAVPSRSMPQGYHGDGTPAELPPLPNDEADLDSSESGSSEPKPSPQTKKPKAEKTAVDPGANKASFTPPRSPAVFLPSVFLARPSVGFQFLLPLSPLSLKLPFNQRLEIEIYGRMVPETDAR